MNFVFNLKILRQEKGLTQKDLADAIGIPYQNISDYERSVREPSLERAMQIATILECSLDDLVDTERYIKDYHEFLYSLSIDSENPTSD